MLRLCEKAGLLFDHPRMINWSVPTFEITRLRSDGNPTYCEPKSIEVALSAICGAPVRLLLATADRFFVYPTKLREYQARYRGAFLHGGITPEDGFTESQSGEAWSRIAMSSCT